MTRRKVDPLVSCHAFVRREHYACRIRFDQWQELKLRCARLNCSQGVYLEILLEKVFSASDAMAFVSDKEGFVFSGVG